VRQLHLLSLSRCGAARHTQGNWTAALKLMDVDGLRAPPLTTPAAFHINYLRPIPSDEEVFISSTCETPVECSEVVPNSQRVQVEVRQAAARRNLTPPFPTRKGPPNLPIIEAFGGFLRAGSRRRPGSLL